MTNDIISAELLEKVEEAARQENRKPADVVSDALTKYLGDQKWERLVRRGQKRAKALGLTDADVPRLIEEVRAENRTRGR